MPQAHVKMTFTAAFEVSPEEFKHFPFNTRLCVCVCVCWRFWRFGGGGLVTMALGRCLNSSVIPLRDGTYCSPSRDRERDRGLITKIYCLQALKRRDHCHGYACNRVTKNKSHMPRGVQIKDRIKVKEQRCCADAVPSFVQQIVKSAQG